MREILLKTVKKVTLEIVYEVVDERTKAILEEIGEIKKRQEGDFRFLNQKMDNTATQLNQKIDTQIAQVREEIGQLRQEIGQLRQEIFQVNQRIDQLNQRVDTIIQLLIDLRRGG